MRWLKSLVIFLAVLIAMAIGLLGYGFVKRTENPNWRLFGMTETTPQPEQAATPVPQTASAEPATPWGDISLGLPADCRITAVIPDGQRLYLSVGPDGPCHRLVVIDTNAGRILGAMRPGP